MSKPKENRSTSFVRSWDTEVPVSRTAASVEELVRRYGASGFTRSEDYEQGRIVVAFTLAGRDLRLLVDVPTVQRKLLALPDFIKKRDGKRREDRATWAWAQAERVAWRHLLMYVEAGLNAVSAGLLTLESAFFAHALIETPDGSKRLASDIALAAEEHSKRLAAG